MSLYATRKNSLKDKLHQQEIELLAELKAVEKAKVRADKEEDDTPKRGPGRPKKAKEELTDA